MRFRTAGVLRADFQGGVGVLHSRPIDSELECVLATFRALASHYRITTAARQAVAKQALQPIILGNTHPSVFADRQELANDFIIPAVHGELLCTLIDVSHQLIYAV